MFEALAELAEGRNLRRVEGLQAVQMLADRLRARDRRDAELEESLEGRAQRHTVDEIDQLDVAQIRASDRRSRARIFEQHRMPQQRLEQTCLVAWLSADQRRDARTGQQAGDVI